MLAGIAILIALPHVRAGQYDTAIPLRTGTAAFNLPGTGGTNGWSVIAGGTNYGCIALTGGSNGALNSICGPIVSSTSQLLTTGTLPGTTGTNAIVGQLGLSSSGTLIICGTAGSPGTWRNVP